MAISTYAELQTAVQSWLMDRTDLAPYAPDFITLAENWLNYGSDTSGPLRTTEMEATTTLSPALGVAALPADFLEYISVTPVASHRFPLLYMTPDQAARSYSAGAGGVPVHFSIVGTNLQTYPYDSTGLRLHYYQAIPSLSDVQPTNWLLTKSPGVYLRAALAQAAEFVKDDGEAMKQFEMARALVAGLNLSSMRSKYARVGLAVRGPTP